MKIFCFRKSLLIAFLPIVLANELLAADPYADIRKLSFGQSTDSVLAIQAEITAAKPDQLREIERKLIAVLQSPDSTPDAKSWVCRTLRLAGSEQCVPAVTPLLTDPKLGPDAQFALRSLHGDKVDEALRACLSKTTGLLKAGIIQTLGARRDAKSVSTIGPTASDADPVVADATLYALGQIGGPDALKALQNAKPAASLERARQHGIVVCAESLLAQGNKSESAKVCRKLYTSSRDGVIKSAALDVLFKSDPIAAGPLLNQALSSEDRVLSSSAVRLVCQDPDPSRSGSLKNLTKLPPATLAAILSSATNRTLLSPARMALEQGPEVRGAALSAVGRLGSADDALLLLQAAAESGPHQAVARNAVAVLRGAGVNEALLTSAQAGSAGVAREAVRALTARNCTEAAPLFFDLAEGRYAGRDAPVRAEAFRGLGELANPGDVSKLLGLLLKSAVSDLEAAEAALISLVQRGSPSSSCIELILQALPQTRIEPRCTLLRVLSHFPDQNTLVAVGAAAFSRNSDPMVTETAIRCLADWPNPAAAPDLLAAFDSSTNAALRTIALRGYIRLAAMPGQQPKEQVKMLTDGLALASSSDEKRAGLGALADIGDKSALALAVGYLADKDVETEAANATVRLARKLQASDPEAAGAAIQKILDTCPSGPARQLAESAGVVLGGMVNIAPLGIASSPDGLEKDGQAGGDQAGIDGNPATYWDKQDNAKLYRYVVSFKAPEKIAALSIMGYQHHNFAPKDFEVLCDQRW